LLPIIGSKRSKFNKRSRKLRRCQNQLFWNLTTQL
jgi:hypothetical protein